MNATGCLSKNLSTVVKTSPLSLVKERRDLTNQTDIEHQGAVVLTGGSVLRGTILNYVIFIGHYRGQPIQQAIKMT